MKRILILGAGFGGIQAATHLEREFAGRDGAEITVVNANNYFMFTPLLPQIASSYINPRHIVQPVRDIRGRRRFRFVRDTVESIDVAGRRVTCTSGALEYDYLIFALGSRTEYFRTPGAAEFTCDFKSLEDAVVLREHVLDLCEHADHTPDPAARARMMRFVVVGGGYTGVELICELQDFLFYYVARRYRGIRKEDVQLVVLEAANHFLAGVHPSLAADAHRRLQAEGIEIRPNSRVTRCFAGGVEINGSEILESETVVWAAGVRAHELAEALPGAHDRIGRAMVNAHLQLENHPEVFVLGDSAAAASAPDAPRVAPVAIVQGRLAARNIVRLERGEPLQSYRYVSQGVTVSLGMNYAVVSVGRFDFRGYSAWLFWNALHLLKLVGLKKQLQVALDWMLSAIFPRDASIVRRPRGCRFCGARKGAQGSA